VLLLLEAAGVPVVQRKALREPAVLIPVTVVVMVARVAFHPVFMRVAAAVLADILATVALV
jgi:hypothetical protein